MNRKIKIAPSIFAADFYSLSDAVALFEKTGVDAIHYDVMDNHFVPNISVMQLFRVTLYFSMR